jgi:hypothetical protein
MGNKGIIGGGKQSVSVHQEFAMLMHKKKNIHSIYKKNQSYNCTILLLKFGNKSRTIKRENMHGQAIPGSFTVLHNNIPFCDIVMFAVCKTAHKRSGLRCWRGSQGSRENH